MQIPVDGFWAADRDRFEDRTAVEPFVFRVHDFSDARGNELSLQSTRKFRYALNARASSQWNTFPPPFAYGLPLHTEESS